MPGLLLLTSVRRKRETQLDISQARHAAPDDALTNSPSVLRGIQIWRRRQHSICDPAVVLPFAGGQCAGHLAATRSAFADELEGMQDGAARPYADAMRDSARRFPGQRRTVLSTPAVDRRH